MSLDDELRYVENIDPLHIMPEWDIRLWARCLRYHMNFIERVPRWYVEPEFIKISTLPFLR